METALKRIKLLRKEKGYTIQDIAEYLHIEEKQYLQFERGKSKKEMSYYILVNLAKLYGVSVDYLIGSYVWQSDEFRSSLRSDLPDFSLLSDKQSFLEEVKKLEHISRKSFEIMNKNRAVTQYTYIDENGDTQSAALAIGAPNEGELCFVAVEKQVKTGYLQIENGAEYFEFGENKYFIENGDAEILCKIFAQIDD